MEFAVVPELGVFGFNYRIVTSQANPRAVRVERQRLLGVYPRAPQAVVSVLFPFGSIEGEQSPLACLGCGKLGVHVIIVALFAVAPRC